MDHEVHHPVAVAEFIVIPGNELDKMVFEVSPRIKDERVGVIIKVSRDNPLLSASLPS